MFVNIDNAIGMDVWLNAKKNTRTIVRVQIACAWPINTCMKMKWCKCSDFISLIQHVGASVNSVRSLTSFTLNTLVLYLLGVSHLL